MHLERDPDPFDVIISLAHTDLPAASVGAWLASPRPLRRAQARSGFLSPSLKWNLLSQTWSEIIGS